MDEKSMELLIALVPALQTIIWAIVAVIGFLLVRRVLVEFVASVTKRVEAGDSVILPFGSLTPREDREPKIVDQVIKRLMLEAEGLDPTNQEQTLRDRLSTAVSETERNFLEIIFPESSNDQSVTISLFITDWETVSDFLNDVYYASCEIDAGIPVFTYGTKWRMRNLRTGRTIQKKPDDNNFDERPFSVLGLKPADRLLVEWMH